MNKVEPAEVITTTYSEYDDECGVFCPHCGIEQDENPINILMGSDECAEWDCDECGKEFTLTATRFIQYTTSI
jgi:hypothetical protein